METREQLDVRFNSISNDLVLTGTNWPEFFNQCYDMWIRLINSCLDETSLSDDDYRLLIEEAENLIKDINENFGGG
jgi:hypothetical protein